MDKKTRQLAMGKLYMKMKNYKMAEQSLIEHLTMYPESVEAMRLLAQVYEQNRRFDKALEFYEGSFAVDPDRKGVLLDICRVLLTNEIGLEQVDYKKWLSLATEAFPMNPIVLNLKAYLSKLRPDDRGSFQNKEFESTVSHPQEGPLAKILDKLSSIEQRLLDIENKIGKMSLSNSQTETKQVSSPAVSGSTFAFTSNLFSDGIKQPDSSKSEPKIDKQVSSPVGSGGSFAITSSLFSDSVKISDPPKTDKQVSSPFGAGNAFTMNSNFFSDNVKKPDPPKVDKQVSSPFGAGNTFTMNSNLFSDSIKKSEPPLNEPKIDRPVSSPFGGGAFNLSGSLFADSLKNLDQTKNGPKPEQQVPSPFGAGGAFSLSGNLFADSINKFNIPTDQAWTAKQGFNFNFNSSQPKEEPTTVEEADNEVVPNEELAIENTCDMEPIEIKTGEEDEDVIFEYRCKLFRFRDREYKERGLGAIKVLKHKQTGKGRLIMRREAVGLVCLNCWDCDKVERVRDTQVRWAGIDASDGEPEPTIFLAKFKTQELTDTFMSHLTSLFSDGPASPPPKNAIEKPKKSESVESEVELVEPELDQGLVDKARELYLPDLFYHNLKYHEPCGSCAEEE